jgi:membrane protein required for colicin V production
MFIDFLFCILMVLAVFKGFSRGFIVAIFSLVAFFIGLVAAMKLSASVAVWLQNRSGTHSSWMPFIAFVLVMAIVMLVIRFGAKLIERAIQFAMLGWLNRLGGIIFYAVLYITFFSIILFFAKGMGILHEETMKESRTYAFLVPWGPKAIDAVGSVIPVFKGLFNQLEGFFNGAAHQIETN